MKRNIVFLSIITTILLVSVFGILVSGIKETSIIENRTLATFPTFSLEQFLDTSYQTDIESALSDQLLFSENLKEIYSDIKSMNTDAVVSIITVAQGNTLKNKTTVTSFANKTKYDDKNTTENVVNTTINETNQDGSNLSERNTDDNNQNESNPRNIAKTLEFYIDLKPKGDNLMGIDETGHLLYPKRTIKNGKDMFEAKAKNYNQLVSDYPDLEFYSYYIETDVDIDFINGSITHDLVNYFYSLLDESIGSSALYINSPEDYAAYFYKSDHHWNVEGQEQGYKNIINLVLGEDEPLLELTSTLIEGLNFSGSKARKINDLSLSDQFYVLTADLGEHTNKTNNEATTYGSKGNYLEGNYSNEKAINHYGACNGADYALIEYDFNQLEKPSILIFVDSYSNPINELIASHFNKTFIVDLRHYKKTMGTSFDFSNFLNENPVDKVLFDGCYFYHANNEFLIGD